MKLIIQFVLMGLAVAAASYILPGVEVAGIRSAIIVAVVLALLNCTVGRILRTLTLPLNWITLGLVSGITSVLMVMLASNLLEGFEVGGFLNAVLFAIVLAIISAIFGLRD